MLLLSASFETRALRHPITLQGLLPGLRTTLISAQAGESLPPCRSPHPAENDKRSTDICAGQ